MKVRLSSGVRAAGVAMVLGALVVAMLPGVTDAKFAPIWGWVTARKPTTASYTPAAKDQGNSYGKTNTVKRVFPGRYDVTFDGLDATVACSTNGCLGSAVATALSTTQRWCVVGDITSSLPVRVYVVCRDRNGNYADSAFSVNFSAPRGLPDALAYVYADEPSTSAYIPDEHYNFNSKDPSTNYIDRLDVGYYMVNLVDMYAGTSGNLQVNGTLGTCKIEKRENNDDPSDIYSSAYVRCRDFAGAPADTAFFLTYAERLGLTFVFNHPTAYVFANKPTSASYHPDASFTYSSAGQTATVSRSSAGVYNVKLPGMPYGGSAQVSAYGTGKSACQLGSIAGKSLPQVVGVRCFAANGSPVDTQFYLTFTN